MVPEEDRLALVESVVEEQVASTPYLTLEGRVRRLANVAAIPSAFEGWHTTSALAVLRQHLADTEGLSPNNRAALGALVEICLRRAWRWKATSAVLAEPRLLERLSRELAGEIAALSPGQKLLVSGGWEGAEHYRGHALFYEVARQPDGRFGVTIYNTGAGARARHQTAERPAESMVAEVEQAGRKSESLVPVRVHGAFAVEDVPEPSLLDTSPEGVLRTLIRPVARVGVWGDDPAGAIYAAVEALGPLAKQRPGAEDWAMQKAQRMGNCAWRSLMCAVRANLPPEEYVRFKDALLERELAEAEQDAFLATGSFNHDGHLRPLRLERLQTLADPILRSIRAAVASAHGEGAAKRVDGIPVDEHLLSTLKGALGIPLWRELRDTEDVKRLTTLLEGSGLKARRPGPEGADPATGYQQVVRALEAKITRRKEKRALEARLAPLGIDRSALRRSPLGFARLVETADKLEAEIRTYETGVEPLGTLKVLAGITQMLRERRVLPADNRRADAIEDSALRTLFDKALLGTEDILDGRARTSSADLAGYLQCFAYVRERAGEKGEKGLALMPEGVEALARETAIRVRDFARGQIAACRGNSSRLGEMSSWQRIVAICRRWLGESEALDAELDPMIADAKALAVDPGLAGEQGLAIEARDLLAAVKAGRYTSADDVDAALMRAYRLSNQALQRGAESPDLQAAIRLLLPGKFHAYLRSARETADPGLKLARVRDARAALATIVDDRGALEAALGPVEVEAHRANVDQLLAALTAPGKKGETPLLQVLVALLGAVHAGVDGRDQLDALRRHLGHLAATEPDLPVLAVTYAASVLRDLDERLARRAGPVAPN